MSTVTGDLAAAPPTGTPDGAGRSVELTIGGMTCASCAARIEKKLNRLEGVTATVNFALEKAKVRFPGSLTPQDLVRVVQQTGYTAALPAPRAAVPAAAAPGAGGEPAGEQDEAAPLLRRLIISAALTVPVIVLAFIPVLQFPPRTGASSTRTAR